MAFIGRIGTQTEKHQLELTIHSVSAHIEVPCSLRVVVKRGQHKYQTQELRHNMSTGVVFFEKEIQFEATMYKRGQSYQEKSMEFRLVKIVGGKHFKDGKGELSLNEIANTGVPVFREDVPLKGSVDKDAVVCISLALTRVSDDLPPPPRSQKLSTTSTAAHFDRSGLSVNTEEAAGEDKKENHTPVTAGPTVSGRSPDRRAREWSPISAHLTPNSLSFTGSPAVKDPVSQSPHKAEAASPASPPLKSILSHPESKKDSPPLKKTVSLKDPEVDDGFMKLYKVQNIDEEPDDGQKESSSDEAPKPVLEGGGEGEEGEDSSGKESSAGEDEEESNEEEVKDDVERKMIERLDLAKLGTEKEVMPVVEFTKGEDTSSEEEPVVVEKERLILSQGPISLLKSSAPNKHSKEASLSAEEQRTGMPATRERSSACNGCVLQ